MRAGWTTLILLGAAVCAQGEPKDITIPSPVGKWVFEAKWHPGHPVGYTWNLKNISSGKVLSRPMRKKVTAISSSDSVKIRRAAAIRDTRRLGNVIHQKVLQ